MADLTVGDGYTYSSIMAAETAANAGDRVLVYYPVGLPIYQETLIISKGIDIIAMDSGISLSNPSVNLTVTATSGTVRVVGFNIYHNQIVLNSTSGATIIFDKNKFTQPKTTYFMSATTTPGEIYFTNNIIAYYDDATYAMYYRQGGSLNLYHNTFIKLTDKGGQLIYGYNTTSTVDAYNNIFINRDSYEIFTAISTLNEDYNAYYSGSTISADQADGANDVARTDIADLGLAAFAASNSMIDNYRTLAGSEVAGTTSANGADLTTWDSGRLNTDIDGRTRSTYAIGCSEGYKAYDGLDLPSINSVLSTDTLEGVAGNWTKATASKYQNGETYGEGGTSETGSYTPDFPDVGNVLTSDTVNGVQGTFDESARNTDPGEANVKDGETYLIQNVSKEGTYDPISNLPQPNAPTVSYVDNGDGTATITVTGSGATQDNTVYYAQKSPNALTFTDCTPFTDDGTVNITGEGDYYVYCDSDLGGINAISNVIKVTITNTTGQPSSFISDDWSEGRSNNSHVRAYGQYAVLRLSCKSGSMRKWAMERVTAVTSKQGMAR
jgi:hypothetical protein